MDERPPDRSALGHPQTPEPRKNAPAIIFQAMHKGVRRRPQNDREARGRELGTPSRTLEASVGGNGARTEWKSAPATTRPRRGAQASSARTTDQLRRALQWKVVSAGYANRRQEEIEELCGRRPAVHAPAAAFKRRPEKTERLPRPASSHRSERPHPTNVRRPQRLGAQASPRHLRPESQGVRRLSQMPSC